LSVSDLRDEVVEIGCHHPTLPSRLIPRKFSSFFVPSRLRAIKIGAHEGTKARRVRPLRIGFSPTMACRFVMFSMIFF
jgi:hypothetical protein